MVTFFWLCSRLFHFFSLITYGTCLLFADDQSGADDDDDDGDDVVRPSFLVMLSDFHLFDRI